MVVMMLSIIVLHRTTASVVLMIAMMRIVADGLAAVHGILKSRLCDRIRMKAPTLILMQRQQVRGLHELEARRRRSGRPVVG